MKIDTIQTSFVSGELAPALFGRTDIAQYANACALVQNFLIRPYGPVISTPGTEYINACKTGGSTSVVRLINFVFSRTDAYIIEMGVGYFRFYTNGGVVVSPGTTPYEVVHTYTASELSEIQFAQFNDVIYITHKSHPPAKLTRFSASNWTLTALPFNGGPFAIDNAIYSGGTTSLLTSATITPSATSGNITLSATSNIFIASGSTLGHINTFWKINTTVTDSTTGLSVQGYVQITAITNPSTATATVIKTLKATTATTIWAQGAWSDVLGWPARVTFHQQRFCMARTNYQPLNVWGSQPFTYENFAVNSGTDDDALNIQLSSNESNEIKWLVSADSLIAGTYAGDFIIKSGDDSPLTPANVNSGQQSSWGSEAIQPKRIGNFFYYVQRFSQKLREIFFDWNLTNAYKSIDKTILSPHIANTGFIDLAYQQNPDTILWAIRSDGTLATMTREVDQEVQGWARQTTDGYYEAIATIPSQSFPHDEVWVVVRRNINGSDVRYIERFKSQIVPTRQDQCFYVHAGLSYDAFNATTTPTSTTMSFSFPNSTTKLLLRFNGSDGSTTFTDSAAGKTVTANGNVQLSQTIKKLGSASAFFQNVLGNDSNTKLLLHLDNNVTDSSSSAKTVTNSSVTFSSVIKEFSGYSGVFDGSSSFLSVADSADWNFGSGDFTIDFWARINMLPSGGNSQSFYSQATDTNNYIVFFYDGVQLRFTVKNTGVFTVSYSVNWVPSTSIWYHIAMVRTGSVLKMFVNGTQVGSNGVAATIPDLSGTLNIGKDTTGNGFELFNGYLDEYRVSKGVARWSSNFNSPTLPYSSTADYLSTVDSADWNLSTTDFTIDFFVYPTSGDNQYLLAQGDSTLVNGTFLSITPSTGYIQFFARTGGVYAYNLEVTSSDLAINTWTHIAIARSSGVSKIYVNGVSQTLATQTEGTIGDYAFALEIGRLSGGSAFFNGYLDEFRVVKGSAVYTADFTVPTQESTQSGTIALVTSSAAYFSAGNVGKRLRAIDSNGASLGEMTITGFTSSTIIIGALSKDFDAFTYAAGRWGVSVNTISGLSHLNSETVSSLGDGVPDSPYKVVTSGSITLSSDYFYVTTGIPYTQILKTLPQEAGSQRGTSQGKLQKINQVSFKVNNSYAGFMIGGVLDSLNTLRPSSPSLYTGTIANEYYQDDYRYGSQVVIENSDPLPIELLSIITTLDTKDK